jgi:hypothetical protein
MDAHSDLDFVVAIEPAHVEAMMLEREAIAASLGPLLAAFPGDHVGEVRLLICLYGPPLLHVDLKFVALPDAARRVDENRILFDRDGRFAEILATAHHRYPQPRFQWIEDRFWVWVHYIAGKIARGELFEAIDAIGFLRARVIGPIALAEIGATPNGVRRFETLRPDLAAALRETLASHEPASCARALRASIALYRDLRDRTAPPDLVYRRDAEREAIAFFEQLEMPR